MEKAIYNRMAIIKATTTNKQTGKKSVKERTVNAYKYFNAFVSLAKRTPKIALSIEPDSVEVNYKNISYKGQLLRFI